MFVSKKKFNELSDRLDRYERELEAWKENRTTKVEEIARLLKYKPAATHLFSWRSSIDLGSHIRTCLEEPNKTEDYEITEVPIVEPKIEELRNGKFRKTKKAKKK